MPDAVQAPYPAYRPEPNMQTITIAPQAQLVLASELGRCSRRAGHLVAGRGNGPAYAD